MSSNAKEITLKLVVDGGSKKILYAEAKKDFVDFLFGLLQMPIGSIMTLLAGNGLKVLASLGRVSQSLSNLETNHFHSTQLKETLLKPKVARISYGPPLLLQEYFCWNETGFLNGEGYVKDNSTFMVMDDLEISPMSSIPVLALLKRINVGLLQEKIVKIDLSKGLELVKASMESNTALTDVFMPK